MFIQCVSVQEKAINCATVCDWAADLFRLMCDFLRRIQVILLLPLLKERESMFSNATLSRIDN